MEIPYFGSAMADMAHMLLDIAATRAILPADLI
jgi:hypothetical protein